MKSRLVLNPQKSSVLHLKTPNDQEKGQCIEKLNEVDIAVCGTCLREEDGSGNRLVQWIECDNCSIWYHKSCVVEINDDENDDVFICHFCLQ